jgi:hypothetical protein
VEAMIQFPAKCQSYPQHSLLPLPASNILMLNILVPKLNVQTLPNNPSHVWFKLKTSVAGHAYFTCVPSFDLPLVNSLL